VVLFERDQELGGQVKIAMKAPGREEFGEVSRYLAGQIQKLDIELRMGVEATAEEVMGLRPEAVVVATGARPMVPQVEGREVFTAWDVLRGKVPGGQKMVVVDGDKENQVAIGAAEYLADRGKQVEIISQLPYVGKDLDTLNFVPVYKRLFEKGVRVTPHLGWRRVEGRGIVLYNVYTWKEEVREGIDGIVWALGRQVEDGLYHALKGRVEKLYRIGDCLAPRSVLAAVSEGTRIGRII